MWRTEISEMYLYMGKGFEEKQRKRIGVDNLLVRYQQNAEFLMSTEITSESVFEPC